MTFDDLVGIMRQFEGVNILSTHKDDNEYWVHFRCDNTQSLAFFDKFAKDCGQLLHISDRNQPEATTYQLVFRKNKDEMTAEYIRQLQDVFDSQAEARGKAKELGIPDLSVVTARQMAMELKRRPNICFALVWMENTNRDNIAIEGSGNPTQVVGLLARGLNMSFQWADKNIQFRRPKDE